VIGKWLKVSECDEADTILERFWALLNKVRTCHDAIVFAPGNVNVIDLSGYSASTQKLLAEMLLATL